MNLLARSIIIFILLITTNAFSNDKELTRRGFLSFLGGGAAASAAIANGGLNSVATIFEEGGLNSSKLIEHLRTSLKKGGFLNTDSPSNILNADTKIHEYERVLKILDSDPSLPPNAKQQIGRYLKELNDVYYKPGVAAVKPTHYESPTGNYNVSNNSTPNTNSVDSQDSMSKHAFYEILKIRSSLTVRLLNRLDWQYNYPEDLILRDQQGSRDYKDLSFYKSELIRLLINVDSPVKKDEFMKAYVLFLIQEVNSVLHSDPVQEWKSNQVRLGNVSTRAICKYTLR